jgi:hypothetical protein
VACVRWVLEEMPKGLGRDVNTMSRPRHGVAVHDKAVAGSWRSMARLGMARPHNAAAEGDGGCGVRHAARWVLAQKRHAGRMGEGS